MKFFGRHLNALSSPPLWKFLCSHNIWWKSLLASNKVMTFSQNDAVKMVLNSSLNSGMCFLVLPTHPKGLSPSIRKAWFNVDTISGAGSASPIIAVESWNKSSEVNAGGFLTGEVRHNFTALCTRARVGPLCGRRIYEGCHRRSINPNRSGYLYLGISIAILTPLFSLWTNRCLL